MESRFEKTFFIRFLGMCLALTALAVWLAAATQDAPGGTSKPTEHLIGTIAGIDAAAHTITVKDDKSGVEQSILLANTKTLIKVPPGAKDLKNFTRITADELVTGDRVDVRGSKPPDDPSKIAARSVVLMSGRDLQAAHQAQAAEWQSATAGVVSSVDAADQKIAITQRTPEGTKPVILSVSGQTEFTRYSPAAPGTPASSQLAQIQPGDQVRVIGEKSADGASIAARRIYSGAFHTWNGAVVSVGPDGKQLFIKDLASKKPMTVALNDQSTVQKIPPEIATRMALRMNAVRPASQGTAAEGTTPGAETLSSTAVPAGPAGQSTGQTHGPESARGPSDISQWIERLPKIAVTDLKPGDAVVISGIASNTEGGPVTATHIIAGVEPILQSAPSRQRGQTLGGDWGLGEMTAPQ